VDAVTGELSFAASALMQTDRTWRRSSGVLSGEFADELGVCRDSRTVTSGMCLNADDLSLALTIWAPELGLCR
jgi:hypothetical protein